MKIKRFIKNNYGFIAAISVVVIFGILFQNFFMRKVLSDDYMYTVAAKGTLENLKYFMDYHYNFCNGRTLIHLFLIFMLKFDVYAWRIIMPLIMGGMVVFSGYLFSDDKKNQNRIMLFTAVALFAVQCEVYDTALFWMAGSVNYVLPGFLILGFLCVFKSRKCIFITPILSLICAATTEQYGCILSGFLLLYIFKTIFVDKKRPNVFHIVAFVTAIIGTVTVVLSPSVSARTYNDTARFVDKLSMLIFDYWFNSKGMILFLAFLLIVISITLIQYSGKKLSIPAYIFPFFMAALYVVIKLQIPLLSSLATLALPVVFIAGAFLAAFLAIKQRKNFIPLFCLILAGGAQFMMLFTTRISMRTTAPSVFCFIFFAVSLISQIISNPGDNAPKRFIPFVASSLAVIIAVCNIFGYAQFAKEERALFEKGEYYAVYFDHPTTREDIEKVIDTFEEVRQNEILKYQNQSNSSNN